MNQYDEYAQMMNGAQSNGISQSNGIIPVQPIVQPANITNEAVVLDSVDIPQNVNGGTFDPFCEIDVLPLENADGFHGHRMLICILKMPTFIIYMITMFRLKAVEIYMEPENKTACSMNC